MPSTTPVQTIYMPTTQTLVVCDQNRPPPPFPTPPDPTSNNTPPPIPVQTRPAPTTITSVATEAPVPLRPIDPVESPAMSPPVNSTFSPHLASPLREETCIRSLAWGGLKSFARVLVTSGGDFGPLKSAIGFFASFVEAHEAARETRNEYKTLATELDGLFQDLAGAFASEESIPPGMKSSIMNLATSLDQEIAFLRGKDTRSGLGRHLQASQDLDEVLECYRRIHTQLERLTLNANVKVWMLVQEEATQSRLKDLGQSHAAWYSSAESKKLYRDECTPDTRVEALERFRVWRDGENTEKIYWLNGMAGTGKTTLSYTLCKQLEHEQRLAANFFCSRQLPDCKKAHRILPTIACQLADFSYPFRYALSSILRQDPNVHTQRISEQCAKLLFAPLHEVRASLPHNLVVVIEALDECDNSDEVDELLEMLFEYAPRFPVKFFLTSRPEPVIRVRMLGRTGPREEFELHLHELDREIVGEDIKKYLEVGLRRANISAGDLQVLTERSGVLFIYAATVVRFIGDQSFTKSADRLELVLSEATSSSGSERGIDALYTLILRQAFGRLVNTERQNMRLVLHTAICSREPLAVCTMANLLQMRVESVHSALSALRSVLNVEQSSEEITTLHKSFPDYILDSTRSRGFSCDAKKRHAELAQQCFAITNAPNPLFNTWHISDMGYHSRHARAVPALIEKPGMDISGEIFYAFRYWGAHLCLAEDSKHLLGESYTFLSERLLLWVEIMKLKQCLQPSGVAMLSEVQIWTRNSKYDARDGTQELLKDAIRGIKTGRIGFR